MCPGKPRITERKKKVKSHSRVRFFATPWTVAYQVPPSMEFFKQEYWSGLPFPSPRDLPDPAIKPRSPELQADALPPEPPGKPGSPVKSQLPFPVFILYLISSTVSSLRAAVTPPARVWAHSSASHKSEPTRGCQWNSRYSRN